jgi:hypothetical protein
VIVGQFSEGAHPRRAFRIDLSQKKVGRLRTDLASFLVDGRKRYGEDIRIVNIACAHDSIRIGMQREAALR